MMTNIPLELDTMKRSEGANSLAVSAYVEDRDMIDDRTGQKFRFGGDGSLKHKTTFCLGTELGDGTTIDTQDFWNAVEKSEKRKDSQLGRKMWCALPDCFTHDQNVAAITELRQWLADRYGMATTAAIHYEHAHNPHFHMMQSRRQAVSDGKGGVLFGDTFDALDKKTKSKAEIKAMREQWALICNKWLPADRQLDPRSYAEQENGRIPTIHRGAAASRIHARGEQSYRYDEWLESVEAQRERDKQIAQIEADLQAEWDRQEQEEREKERVAAMAMAIVERKERENATAIERSTKSHAGRLQERGKLETAPAGGDRALSGSPAEGRARGAATGAGRVRGRSHEMGEQPQQTPIGAPERNHAGSDGGGNISNRPPESDRGAASQDRAKTWIDQMKKTFAKATETAEKIFHGLRTKREMIAIRNGIEEREDMEHGEYQYHRHD